VDIAPTILDLAEYRVLTDSQGFSLRPRFGGQRLPDRPIFFEAVGGKSLQPDKLIAGVRFDRWKYICAPHSTAFDAELFDLQADPNEQTNVASQHAEIVARARLLLDAHYQDALAPEAQWKMTAEEEAVVTERLRDLGYIE
jgi:arylsulfatase A-like enzyme